MGLITYQAVMDVNNNKNDRDMIQKCNVLDIVLLFVQIFHKVLFTKLQD